MKVQTILSRGCFGAVHTGRMAGVPITCERRMHFNIRGVWGAVAVVCSVVGGQVYRKAPTRESAQGECKHRESAAGHVGAGHTKQRRDLSAGPKQAGRAALCSRQASLGGRRRLLHGRGGPGKEAP